MTLREQFESLKYNGYVCDNKVDANGCEHSGADGQFVKKSGGETSSEGSEKKDQRGDPITTVSGVTNIKETEFENPTHSYLLPMLNKKFSDAIQKANKKVLLSKHTINRMKKEHKEMKDGVNRRRILNNALNNFTELFYDRPKTKPNYYVVMKTGKHYDMAVIDTDSHKEYFEITDWREINKDGYDKMINNMGLEDGQFLITDGRTSTGQPTFLLFNPETNIAHDTAEVKSLRDIYNRIKGL